MTKTIPSYLRLHSEPASVPSALAGSTRDSLSEFWDAFHDATGWRRNERAGEGEAPQLLPAAIDPMVDGADSDAIPAVSQRHANRLAGAATRLTSQLEQAREALRRQEAELAARASIVGDDQARGELIEHLEQTLADAAVACGCDAAVLYLLDDDTETLKARAAIGMPADTLERSPRTLRGSRGDLEALVQGVVTINDFHAGSIDTWNSPEPFAGGICASVNQDDVPIGTLWLFASETCEFGDRESAVGRIAAKQLALHLSRAANGQQFQLEKEQTSVVREIAEWQFQGLPSGTRLAEDWRVDGMIESPQGWATGWHTWDVLPDGSLMMAMAESADPAIMGAMSAAIARAALTAHTGYRHTPRQMLQRVGDTLWQSSTGQQLVSMLYLRVDPETGEGEVASAGDISALVASRYGYRPLVDGAGEPLTTHIEPQCVVETFHMMPGETMLAYGNGVRLDGATQTMLGDAIRSAMQRPNGNPLANVRRGLAGHALQHERGIMALTRNESDHL